MVNSNPMFSHKIFSLNELFKTQNGKKLYSPIIWDYLSGNANLKNYYKYPPDLNSFKQAIKDKTKSGVNRELLVSVLTGQYANIKKPPENIKKLIHPNTFTITTGHQLCLFMGPLYFAYKIISAINLAAELKKVYPENDFVPVYWMASEDHDLEEINHLYLFGKKIEWNIQEKGPAGRLNSASLAEVINALKTGIKNSEIFDSFVTILENAYLNHDNLADATRCLVHELFGKYGLVVIDGDDRELKSSYGKIMKEELEADTSFRLVGNAYKELSHSYKLPVKPREINLFYMNEAGRNRIVKEGGSSYGVLDTPIGFDKTQILEEMDRHPERFSPNVVLRPVYQEFILPDLAYVGGPTEIAYWLELKSLFDYHKVNFPVLVLRNSAAIISKKEVQKMSKLGITAEDFFQEINQIVKSFIERKSEVDLSLSVEKMQIEKIFSTILSKASGIDITLHSSVQAELVKVLQSLSNIEKKLVKQEKKKNETAVNQIIGIKENLFPNSVFQERHYSFLSALVKYDLQFIEMLRDTFKTMENGLYLIFENDAL